MAYLCNTFFSTEKMPGVIGTVVSALPLSKTSGLIRGISQGGAADPGAILVLILYLAIFTGIAFWFIYKKKNL